MKFDKVLFGKTRDEETVYEYFLENECGLKISAISYGAALRTVILPDGRDIVLGFDTQEGYEAHDKYMGAVAGRCANRISRGCFELNNKEYSLALNDGHNHLHGGIAGFDKKIWSGAVMDGSMEFTLFSPDGDEGYPGNLSVRVRYTLTEENEIIIDYFALSDEDTIVNLTNHSYFNLNGRGTIESHLLEIPAEEFLEIDENGCSTGNIIPVEDTPLDFRDFKEIGIDINSDYMKNASGYDHNFVLKRENNREMKKAAVLTAGDIRLEAWTDRPGMHFYSGNYLDGRILGKGGVRYEKRSGLALETQAWPDAINHRGFPSPVLKRGEEFRSRTVFKLFFREGLI